MSARIFVNGFGAVSPAGWGVPALRQALHAGVALPIVELPGPQGGKALRTRQVLPPPTRPAFVAHSRLRRTSPITQYAVAAALEALEMAAGLEDRIGVIMCLQSGCVQFSYRFFGEVVKDPATASPLLFPETVLAAPASHLAALLQNVQRVHTLVGDPATFLQGVALGADWLLEEKVDRCLVIGAEEINWLLGDALWTFDHQAVLSAGAGALCLSRERGGIELERITDVFTFLSTVNRTEAARQMRAQLPASSADQVLCEGVQGHSRVDAPELAAWQDWTGPRLRPKVILGEGLSAATAWQCVAACDAVANGSATAGVVSLVGCNQQAIGARFVRPA